MLGVERTFRSGYRNTAGAGHFTINCVQPRCILTRCRFCPIARALVRNDTGGGVHKG